MLTTAEQEHPGAGVTSASTFSLFPWHTCLLPGCCAGACRWQGQSPGSHPANTTPQAQADPVPQPNRTHSVPFPQQGSIHQQSRTSLPQPRGNNEPVKQQGLGGCLGKAFHPHLMHFPMSFLKGFLAPDRSALHGDGFSCPGRGSLALQHSFALQPSTAEAKLSSPSCLMYAAGALICG